ncbi:MAG TPA: winged helix DNA-binding domain-containing protein [Vicinamibacteria bacterium]|nr:winged helix DNA-binding domain-containing protein [Vicinamibacteria bacterium]
MRVTAITRRRLVSQQIARPRFTTPADLVRWMGAVQAQDHLGSRWALGLRLPSAVESDVEDAVAARTIVRTWPMRGTLHYVPAADVRWMLRLLTPRVIARSAGRYRELELDAAALRRATKVLARALKGHALTRAEAYAALARGGVSPAGQRGIHILGHLAQLGLVCFGSRRGKQPTFVLLEEWLPPSPDPSREEALATLAARYFASHGPATAHDFAWWTGLLLKDAQAAIAAAGSRVVAEPHEGRLLFSSVEARPFPASRRTTAVLLPPWDEYVVAYKDRVAVLDPPAAAADRVYAVGLSLVVIDGRVRGSWRRSLAGATARLSVTFWNAVTRDERGAVEAAAERYGRFLGLGVQVEAGTLR